MRGVPGSARRIASLTAATPLVLAVVAVMALSSAGPAKAFRQLPNEQLAAREVVVNLFAHITVVMANANSLGYVGRFDALYPAVRRAYNIPVMARASLDRNWAQLSTVQKANFVDFFRRLTVARYANRIDRPYPVTFHVDGVSLGPGRTLRVNTHMKVPSGHKRATIGFLLRRYAGEWKVIDVILPGGLSELITRRAEYTTVYARKGFESLMAKMYVRTQALAIPGDRPQSIGENIGGTNR